MFAEALRREFEFANPATQQETEPRGDEEQEAYRRHSRSSDRLLRWSSLLYTAFFFIEPTLRHDLRHWLWFAAFYATFLALYAGITLSRSAGMQKLLFLLMFVLVFAYYPFCSSISGAFVYPVVMLAFSLRRTRAFLIVLGLQIAGLVLETWLLHLFWWSTAMGVFFCLVIGLSNLSYARHKRAAILLSRANDEIERLAQVAERERIARDLHDLLGHTLTVIAIKSELASRILPHDAGRAAQEMREVEQTAREALAEVREAVTGYRSNGLETEVSRARRTLAAAGLQLTASLGTVEVTPAESSVLSMVLREAVTNVIRHAQASACTLRLWREHGGLHLEVADDGVGHASTEGNGLRGMCERVEAAGGSVNRAAVPGSGTTLSVWLPSLLPNTAKSPVETMCGREAARA